MTSSMYMSKSFVCVRMLFLFGVFRPVKRRSWFEHKSNMGESLSYEIAVTKDKENMQAADDEEKYYLILDHFTAQPKVDFGKVMVIF